MTTGNKVKVLSGTSWTLFDQFFTQGFQFVISIILARLIPPSEYGLLAMVLVFISVSTVFVDFGFGRALIQKKNLSEEDLSSVFWFNVSAGFLLSLVLFSFSGPISDFYEQPRLVLITQVISITFLISSFSAIQTTILTRDLSFKKLSIVRILAMVISSAVSITMAFLGYGVWSLVAATLSQGVATALMLWFSSAWRPKFIFSKSALKSVLSFGASVTMSDLINTGAINLVNSLIGKSLGSAALGIYRKAIQLQILPLSSVANSIGKVMYPVFSSIQDDKEKSAVIFLKISRMISFISIPLMFLLSLLSTEFVLGLFGSKWEKMIIVFQFLCLRGAIVPVFNFGGLIYHSQGKPQIGLVVTIFYETFQLASLLFALYMFDSIEDVALTYTCIAWTVGWVIHRVPIKLLNIKLFEQFKNLFPTFVVSIISLIPVFIIQRYEVLSFGFLLNFLVLFSLGGLVFIGVSLLVKMKPLIEIRQEVLPHFLKYLKRK